MRICHEAAEAAEAAAGLDDDEARSSLGEAASAGASGGEGEGAGGALQARRLRPVTHADLDRAAARLSTSVNERGREAQRVTEWNEQYGEIKKKKKRPSYSMYL